MAEPETRKIAFICCTNDPEAFEECAAFIRELVVPAGHTVELLPVIGAQSMATGYNEAMKKSSADIKIYLHQDLLILHRLFLVDLVGLFETRSDVGMVGVVGARTFPMHGHWWEGLETVGKLYSSDHGRVQQIQFGSFDGDICEVEVVDGVLMATQYDLPWREDLLDGWHFYDISHCMEFLKAGYSVAVPRQSSPWCLHDCGVSSHEPPFVEAKRRFFGEYGSMLRLRRRRTIIGEPT
jgi:hypothetical protein